MNKHLITFISILILGLALIVGWKYTKPILQERLQKGSSDASSTLATLRIGTDNWIGYFPLCSPGMERNLRQAGYQLQCEDDQADYVSRFNKLAKGKLEFAVATVDSYLLNGRKVNYPGTIITVLDESKGGDAIVAKRDVFPTIDALKLDDLKNMPGKIAFTPASPSEHLLKGVSNHFGLPFFTEKDSGKWSVKTSGSEEALAKLRDNKVAAAVLWEPDVSRALALPGIVKLIGTGDTARLIVDVLIVDRHYSIEHPEAVQALIKAYFQTLDQYMQDPISLQRDIREATSLSDDQINAMLKGVEWATLAENNSLWFTQNKGGVKATEGLVDTINFALKILQASGDIESNPLPGSDPYRITNRQFIKAIAKNNKNSGGSPVDSLSRPFSRLDNEKWMRLKKVGTLKVDPIPFRRSTASFDHAGTEIIDAAASKLRRYP
ncbi:MAG: hypothetical protein KAI39_04265, partial [Desulfobulbaceae bacterium]|nr:hypothetical protein [Desulfobulbaceae bacterium]